MQQLKEGQIITYKKIFTKEEVSYIGKVMGFLGSHHEKPNEKGQYLNQGLLSAILTNRIGGEYNILMYKMDFQFLEKVYTDEEIVCENKIIKIEEKRNKKHIKIKSELFNEENKLVLSGILEGILLE